MVRWVFAAVAAVGSTGMLAASFPAQDDFFLEGNRLYQDGDFDGALAAYQRIEDAGFESGPLFYNMGNTYFKLAELGPAILYYERASRLMPGDDDLQANLALARSLTRDEVAPLPGFLPFRVTRWWVYLLSPGLLAWVVGVAYTVTMAGLLLLVLRPSPALETWGRRIAIVAGSVTVVFGINLVAMGLRLGDPPRAVIMNETVDVQSAPSADPSLQVFTVHEGTTVRIDRRTDAWAEVVLEDGQVGWVRLEDMTEI